jgi:hypothetical protein
MPLIIKTVAAPRLQEGMFKVASNSPLECIRLVGAAWYPPLPRWRCAHPVPSKIRRPEGPFPVPGLPDADRLSCHPVRSRSADFGESSDPSRYSHHPRFYVATANSV